MTIMIEVVAALIWDGDRFLICQRPENKERGLLWEYVGGKVEPGMFLWMWYTNTPTSLFT